MTCLAAVIAVSFTFAGAAVTAADQPVIGLITQTETKPFFVKMREGAQASAVGIEAGIAYAKDGEKVKRHTDTGVPLMSDKPTKGVNSKAAEVGTDLCWWNT